MEVLFKVDYLNVLGNDLLKQESAVSEQGIIGYSLESLESCSTTDSPLLCLSSFRFTLARL